MALLTANGLKKSFGDHVLFENVSFTLNNKDRIGFAGANGVGKTTLFKLITGEITPDEGNIYTDKLIKIGVIGQTPDIPKGNSIFEFALMEFKNLLDIEDELNDIANELEQSAHNHVKLQKLINRQHTLQQRFNDDGGNTISSRVRSALLGLGFSADDLLRPASTLSGGQVNKVMLARVLLKNANLLLLDEPTNHLDISSVEWLEDFLINYKGAFIVISHDRYFLDNVTQKTMEIRPGGFAFSEGNYSTHLALMENENEFAARKYYNTQKEIRRLYGIVEQQRRWNKERNIRTAESKLKQIDRLKGTLVEPEKDRQPLRFMFNPRDISGNDVLTANGLKKAFGDNVLFNDVSLHIRKGERMFLVGPNGCGKTTLLKILAGKSLPDKGVIIPGANVEAAYYEQTVKNMDENNSALDEIWNAYPRLNKTDIHNALAAFLFKKDQVEKKISFLSGGERARIQLLKLMLSNANFLLLDEPTNHLDIHSREALENALFDYNGTFIIVTHDRYLIDKLADRVLYFKDGEIIESIGGYAELSKNVLFEATRTVKGGNRNLTSDYNQKKRMQALAAKLRGEISNVESEISNQETVINSIDGELMAAEYMRANELAVLRANAQNRLDKLYAEWERLQEELEQTRIDDN